MKPTLIILIAALYPAALLAQTPPGASAFQSAESLNAGGRGGRGGGAANILPEPRAEVGKPFSATATTQTVQTYSDGTRVTQTTTMLQYRDAEGRVRTESSEPGVPSNDPAKIITIRDPVARASYRLDPVRRTAVTLSTPIPPGLGSGVPGGRNGGRGGARGGGPPSDATGQAATAYRNLLNQLGALQARINPDGKFEDLGTALVNGVQAQGTRTTTVVPAGAIGNDREFRSISERWFSPELNLLIKSVSTDPRFGTMTYELTNIIRQPPDPLLFQVPADYKVSQSNLAPNTVEQIQFSGASQPAQDTLRGTLQVRVGDPYDEEAVRRDMSAIWKTNRFSEVQVKTEPGTRGGIILRYVVVERQ